MSRYRTALTSVAMCMLLAGLAAAQPVDRPDGPPPGPPPMGPRDPMIQALDADKDGQISAEEIAGAANVLAALDADGDGQLTPEDLRSARPQDRLRQDSKRQRGPQQGAKGPRGMGPQGGPRGHMPPPPSPIVRALDVDRNGVISAEELANAATALAGLDKNGDGALDRIELRPLPPPNPLMRVLDADRDGELSAAELASASTALGSLDKNGDGKVSREELAPPPPAPQTQTGAAAE
jgi:Ca2+-binding EF-hand superfamily protein